MKFDLTKLTEKELIELNHQIIERLKFLQSLRHHNKMMTFKLGDKVSFDPVGYEKQFATVTKFNKKTITVITEDGHRWNVSPHLLTKVSEPEIHQNAPLKRNLN